MSGGIPTLKMQKSATEAWEQEKRASRELVASWMINNGFATGHGDTLDDLLHELEWQVKELRDQLRSYRKEGR
jgi:hypothetical protein